MKFDVFLNRVSVDQISIEAPTTEEARKDTLESVHQHYLSELQKWFTVLESLAWGTETTEEIAADHNLSIEEVLRTRDYPAEYADFMKYILLARRALNLPDLP